MTSSSFFMRIALAGIAFSLPLAFIASTQAGPEFFPLGAANEKNETVIVVSENVLIVRAVNYRSPGASGEGNPGGVVFSLAVAR